MSWKQHDPSSLILVSSEHEENRMNAEKKFNTYSVSSSICSLCVLKP